LSKRDPPDPAPFGFRQGGPDGTRINAMPPATLIAPVPRAYIACMSDLAAIEAEKQKIVEEFALFDSWLERYEYIIELGRKLSGIAPEKRTPEYRVRGCQSQVWFDARREDGRIVFEADSDAMIVRGLIALLLRVYSGRAPEAILATSPAFLEKIELGSHLSGSRANGLAAMVARIHEFARALSGAPLPQA
jgi:cysteine desulfuration protein SufE